MNNLSYKQSKGDNVLDKDRVIIRKNLVLPSTLVIYICVIPMFFIVSYAFFCATNNIYPMLLAYTITFFWTLIYAIRRFGFFSLYCIFMYASIFFMYSVVFAEALLPYKDFDFMSERWPYLLKFDLDVGIKFIVASFIETYMLHVFYCIGSGRKRKQNTKCKKEPLIEKIGICMMACFAIPALTKSILQVRYVLQYGYASVFTDGFSNINYPIWVSGAFAGLSTGYYLFLAGNPSKDKFRIITLIYVGFSLLNALKGQRGPVISLIIICIFWYIKKYNVKISFKRFLIVGLVVIVLIVGIGVFRGNNDELIDDSYDVNTKMENVVDLLLEQSRSRVVPMVVMEGDLQYRNYPFVFSPLLSPYYSLEYGNGQTEEIAQNTNDISNVIMYHLSKTFYLQGNGYGGAFLAEAYDFGGYIGVGVFSVLLALFLSFCDGSNLNVRCYYVPILFQLILNIPMLPRNRVFGFMNNFLVIVFTYLILAFLSFLPQMRENTHKKINIRRL